MPGVRVSECTAPHPHRFSVEPGWDLPWELLRCAHYGGLTCTMVLARRRYHVADAGGELVASVVLLPLEEADPVWVCTAWRDDGANTSWQDGTEAGAEARWARLMGWLRGAPGAPPAR